MIHYQTYGDSGQWLVFIPGLSCASSDWAKQVDGLEQNFRCLCVDLRGHGDSADRPGPYTMEAMAADVVDVLKHLNIANAVVSGHSMGVRVATEVYLQHPAAVGALVFVDGSCQGQGDPQTARERILAFIDDYPSPADFVSEMFASMFVAGAEVPERQSIIDRAAALPGERLKQLMSNLVGWDAAKMNDAFSRVRIPTAVVQSTLIDAGRNRRSMAAGETSPFLDLIAQTIPAARIEVIPGVGHFTQLEAPQAVSAAIRRMAAAVG